MDFNMRVLEECLEKENPVMERVRFLSITASNLDEFFMVRVAGAMEKIRSKYRGNDDPSGLTPKDLYRALSEKIHAFAEKQESCLHRSILPALNRAGIRFLTPDTMDQAQLDYLSEYFRKVLFPVLTPLAVDRSRPFPFLANRSLNIAVRLEGNGGEDCFAVVQVPSILPRFLELPGGEGRCFVLLEDVIMHCMGELFEEKTIRSACPFRITRDSDLEIDEESDDLMIEIQKSIKKRKRGVPVRLEIIRKCDPATKDFLLEMLDVAPDSIYELSGPLDLTFFSKFADLPGCEALCFKPITPVYPLRTSGGAMTFLRPSARRTVWFTTRTKALKSSSISSAPRPRTRMCSPSSRRFTASAAILPLSPRLSARRKMGNR